MVKKRYKKFLYLLQLIFVSINSLYSQSDCYNSDFSAGNFTGWTGYYGTYTDPDKFEGIKLTRQTIITVPSLDKYTCSGLSTIPPGESYSARLGNEKSGAEAEKLVYDISVTDQNSLFIYKYAVVVEDPGHDYNDQPGFSVRILDDNGNEIDPTCGVYEVYAGKPDQNFQECFNADSEIFVKWLPWKTVGLNLAPYIGQNLTIEFTTKDCSFGAHFGYAYISAKCSNFKVDQKSCLNGNNFSLTAPVGFESYSWSYQGQTIATPTQNITLSLADYPIGATFECTMISFSNGNSCEAKVQAVLKEPIVFNTAFSVSIPCNSNLTTFNPIIFNNQTTATNGIISQWNWDFGDGSISTEKNPKHLFVHSGTYTVTLKVTSETGCTNSLSKNIIIDNNPIPIPVLNSNQKFCLQSSATISNIEVNGQNLQWFNSLTSTIPLVSSTILNDASTYYGALVSGNGCLGTRVPVLISLTTNPIPTGNTTQSFCLVENPKISNFIVNGNSILWYATSTGGVPLASSSLLKNGTIYYASQTDNQTGCESSNRLPVSVILNDDSANSPDDYSLEVCLGNNLTLKNLNLDGKNIIFYDSLNSDNPLSPDHPLSNGMTYFASIINPTTNCESLKRTAITVIIKPCDLTVYNTISINNNGLNDYFVIKNIEYFPENTVEIYNRFGQLVYKSSKYGIDNNYFYGDSNAGEVYKKNKKLPMGVYFYIINYKNESTPISRIQKGFLYINNNE
jgi:gliding motility-associated-like protein